jgi:hypothetical protein
MEADECKIDHAFIPRPRKHEVFILLSFHHRIITTKIFTFSSSVPLFNSVSKEIFLGRKKYWRGTCPPPQVTHVFSDKRRNDKKK